MRYKGRGWGGCDNGRGRRGRKREGSGEGKEGIIKKGEERVMEEGRMRKIEGEEGRGKMKEIGVRVVFFMLCF